MSTDPHEDNNLYDLRVCALAGGVGGARLAEGLYRALRPGRLTVLVNTADDFTLFGLNISPDLDTVMYTLAGLANTATGWGVQEESFNAMDMLGRYGEPTWFRLGDRDLATHVRRTYLLREGRSLTAVTRDLTDALGIRARVLPMCDTPVATWIRTRDDHWLTFQEYFVQRSHRDEVAEVTYKGLEYAAPSAEAEAALEDADVVVFCPSNPFVSIGPILAVPSMRQLLIKRRVPCVAITPVIGGRAVKGPAGDMLHSMGHEVSALGVARLYRDLIDAFLIDPTDAALEPHVQGLNIEALVYPALMPTSAEREELARTVLRWATVGHALQGKP